MKTIYAKGDKVLFIASNNNILKYIVTDILIQDTEIVYKISRCEWRIPEETIALDKDLFTSAELAEQEMRRRVNKKLKKLAESKKILITNMKHNIDSLSDNKNFLNK